VHAAKHKKMKELGIEASDPKMLKFVGYYTSTCHASSFNALYLKDIPYQRSVPVIFDENIGNYVVDLETLEEMLQKDMADGLIPFWYGSSWGTTGTCAYD
jgi:hypothetical protein